MEELSDKEKEVLEFLLDYVSTEIFIIEQNEIDVAKLDYSLCLDDNEKQIITNKKVQKFKKKISKCNPTIAGYLNCLTIPDPFNTGFEELSNIITKNFLLSEYYEFFEMLVEQDINELGNYTLKGVIKSLGFNYKPLKFLIEGISDVKIYNSYKSLLFINKENNNSESSKELKNVKKNNQLTAKNDETIPIESFGKYCPNLINDPLFFESNNYVKIKNEFIEEYQSRTAHLSDDEDFIFFETDEDFKYWEETKKEEIKDEFIKLTKQLNKDNVFFFGCSFENYKNNYQKRLKLFLDNYDDTSENDFILSEKSFIDNLNYDLENSTGDIDEFSKSGVEIYNKANYVVSMISYEQYCYSNNKKISFLEQKLLGNNNDAIDVTSNNVKAETPTTTTNLNDSFINDIILEKLEDVLPNVNTTQYGLLVDMLNKYFQNDRVSFKVNKINLGRINKKKVGWALKEIYTTITNEGLTYEYLAFLKENVLLFKDVELNKDDFFYCNLYKYFTTKV